MTFWSLGNNFQQVLELVKRDVKRSEYEKEFVPAIKQLTDKIASKYPQLKRKDKMFIELDENLKGFLREIAISVYTHKLSAYLRRVHQIKDPNTLAFMLNRISFGDNLVIDVFAAYLYFRTGDTAKKNDQFDIKYPFYCHFGDALWTRDELIRMLLEDQLNRSDLLYKETWYFFNDQEQPAAILKQSHY